MERFAAVRAGGRPDLLLPAGSLVEVVGRAGSRRRVRLPDGAAGSVVAGCLRAARPQRLTWNAFSRMIEKVVGTPYLWGGSSTFGFDCSGLVQFMFGFFGISLPRNSRDQAGQGRDVGGLSRLRRLDLVFFGGRGAVDHVAIHLGGRRILHASGHVKIDSLDPKSALFRADLAERFMVARRVVAPAIRGVPGGPSSGRVVR